MGNLQRVRQRFMAVGVLLGAVNLALLVYLLLGGAGGPSLNVLQKKYNDLGIDVARWKTNNPDKTRADLKQFYAEDLPARFSQIDEQVDKLTREAGVTAPSLQYPRANNEEKGGLPDVQEVKIETNVSGDYEKVARFINALEQDKMFFIIEKISLTGQQGGVVSLQITFSTFLRQAAPTPAPPLANKGI